jgi:hypothetical protein
MQRSSTWDRHSGRRSTIREKLPRQQTSGAPQNNSAEDGAIADTVFIDETEVRGLKVTVRPQFPHTTALNAEIEFNTNRFIESDLEALEKEEKERRCSGLSSCKSKEHM